MADIRDTGYLNYRQLQKENQKPFEPSTATNEDWYRHLTQRKVNDYNNQPTEYVGLQAAEAGYGESQYDEGLTSASQLQDLGDIRYENQPWYDTLANGLGKMLGTAGTTFVSSLVGLPYGLFQAANQERWSALWDNSVTQGLAEADKWLEENMTNYRSQVQQNSPWYDPENMFSMNFIADDVIKNMGFTLGAAASMAVGSGSLGLMSKALGFVNDVSKTTKMGQAALSALFSATGEGMIEARQGVEERNKLEMQRLNDSLIPEYNALGMEKQEIDKQYALTGDYDTYKLQMNDYLYKKQELDNRKAAGEQQIIESGQEMGNKILLANQGLLTLGNLVQFGKGMVKSFDSARHAAEVSKKAVKPFGVGATLRRTAEHSGYEIEGKGLGRTIAATKGILTEGSEEMNQQWIQSSAGASVNEADINDYWKAKLNPEAYRDTTQALYTVGSILDRGFQESWGDANQWEQFVIGGLTGMMGSYSPTKLFNQDKTKAAWDPRRYGSWEGGAYNALRDFNKEYNQYQENIDDLNKILASEDFPARVMSAVGHTYTQGEKDAAAGGDDKKAWKDADDKQMVHDIQAFLRAGKLDDLRAIYNDLGSQLSDADVKNIIKSTTKEITIEEDKQNFNRQADEQIAAHQRRITEIDNRIEKLVDDRELLDGSDEIATYTTAIQPEIERLLAEKDKENDDIYNLEQQKQSYVGKKYYEGAYVDREGNVIASDDDIREIVKHNSEELNRKLDSYLDSIAVVQEISHGQLTKDQEDNLAYLHNVSAEKTERVDKIMQKARKSLPSKFLLKTEKTPEQLQKQFASSDLAFSKDESTKKGYVEVDTSLMNDKAFAAFFINNVIGGQNVEAKDQKEGERNSEEQLRTNEELIRKAFIDNAMQKNGMSLEQAMSSTEYDDLIDDINDAVSLHSEAAQFYNTYLEYMLNPAKVDQDKAKEEKKVEEKAKKEKVDNTSLDEMLGMNDLDLGSILADGKKGKNKSGNKARKALGMKNGRSKVQRELDAAVKAGTLDEETASDAMKLLDEQLNRMAKEDDDVDMGSMDAVAAKMFDTDTEAMNDPEVLLTDQELKNLELGNTEFDEATYDARVAKAKDAINSIADNIEKELQEIEDSLDKDMLNKALDDDDTPSEKASKAVSKAADEEATKNSPTPQRNPKSKSDSNEPLKPITTVLKSKKQQEENPITYSGEQAAIDSDRIQGQSGKNIPESEKPSWHPWMSSTSEVGQYTNEPYQPNPDDPEAEFKKKRYDAIRKKLMASGAYTARKEGKIKPGMKIGFVVFQDVNDEADDFVIFITDEHGNIIGDMPSNDPRLATSKRDVPMDAIYEEIKKEWEDASDDEKKEGMKSRFHSEVEHVLVGKVRYQNERQTVEQLFSGKPQPVLFAIKTNASIESSSLHTQGSVNPKKILYPRTGNVGQPYILIQTSGMHKSKNGFKYYAVPVSTKTIGEMGIDVKFKQVLQTLIYNIKQGKINDSEAKKLLQELLAVANVHVNLAEGSDTRKGLGIRITAVDPNTRQLKPIILHSGKREDMDIDAIMNKLADIRANFSMDYINGADRKGIKELLTVDGKVIGSYNEMMAEIAETDAADTQTVNDWFTVRPLIRKGDTLVMTEQDDKLPEWSESETVGLLKVPVKIKGYGSRVWTVDTADSYRVFDEKGDEIIPTKENGSKHTDKEKKMAAVIAAEAFGAAHNMNSDDPFAVTLWGQTQIYYPNKQRFSKKKDIQTILKEVQVEGRTLTEEEKYEVVNSYLENANAALEVEEKPTIQGNRIGSTDHSEEVRQKIAEMEEDASHYHLVKWDEEQQKYVPDPEGDYYLDDRNQIIHARVSNVNDADIEVIEANRKAGFDKVNPQLKKASTGAGNVVDRFVRDFFAGRTGNYPNISAEAQEKLREGLQKFKNSLGPDWEINSTGFVASGIVSFDGETSVNVAGTIDLMAYNPKTGQYAIIDMKSSLAPLFTKGGKLKSDIKTKAKIEHWRAQQTLYKNFLEKKFGIKINGLRILPFSVSYSTSFDETDYSVENEVLKDRGYTVDIAPKYTGMLITLTPKTDVKYQTAQLPNSVKRLLPGYNPVTKKPVDQEIVVKGQLINLRDSLPEGRTLKEFILKEYADNQDVLKLCDILEENKGSNKPIMMTKASQDLLLKAIDKDAIAKAILEAEARKQQLKIDIPTENGMTMVEAEQKMLGYGIHKQDIDELKQLPEEVFIRIAQRKQDSVEALNMLIDEVSIDEIARVFSSPSNAARHKKAKDGEYRKLNLQQEMRWLTKNLPQVSKERRLQIIKGLIACSDGTMDFGRVENGIMQIGTQAEEGTVYHEAFHYVVQFLMTDDEIDSLFKAATEKYGKMPLVALEERLADDFADYVKGIDPEESKIRKFFRELWNAIKSMFNNKAYIDTLFRDINNGVYSGKEFRDDRNNVFTAINNEQRDAAKNYEYLTSSERDRINENGISRETYNAMTKEQQGYMLHCVI